MAGSVHEGNAWTLLMVSVFLLASCFSSSNGQALTVGFGQLDYTGVESALGVNVTVVKTDTNVGNLFVNVRLLTIDQFRMMFGCGPSNLPAGLNCSAVDPAEFDPQGAQDFDANFEVQVEFLPSVGLDEEVITIPYFNDDINEADERFFITVTVDSLSSDPTDVTNAQLLRNGVAQININDDDDLTLSFEMSNYLVSEDAGQLDVIIIKDNGMASEQVLPIIVSLASGTATLGVDFEIAATTQVLDFAPTESRLSIPITIIEDGILESRESFTLQLSIPADPPQGYGLGTTSIATILIDDNERGRVGIEQETYTVFERDGFIEVCFRIFEPMDINLIDLNAFAEFGWYTSNGTAEGGEDFDSVVDNRVFLEPAAPRMCRNVTIIDDILAEGTENFTANIIDDDSGPGFEPVLTANFTIDPVMATIVIIDDETNPNFTDVTPMPEITTTLDSDMGNETTVTGTEVATTDEPSTTTDEPSTTTDEPTTTEPPVTMGGDPHYSIMLPTGQNLCYSVQGEHGFSFNLISNNKMQMNALFVPDARREEVTWIGALGIVLKNVRYKSSNQTKIRFVANENKLYVGEHLNLYVEMVDKLEFSNGKLKISEAEREKGSKRLDVEVDLKDIGLKFTVRFVKKCHLDMFWNEVVDQPRNSHGMIGQFFRSGVEIDETRRLLLLPSMEPVPVMRKPVWHFMEREEAEDKMCWVAMNPGYQGKKLLEGHYLDYLVNDVVSSKFKFTPKNKV